MAENITAASSADLSGNEARRRGDAAGDTGRRETKRARTGAGRPFGGLGLGVFGPVDRAGQVAVQEQHLAGDVVKFLQHGRVSSACTECLRARRYAAFGLYSSDKFDRLT